MNYRKSYVKVIFNYFKGYVGYLRAIVGYPKDYVGLFKGYVHCTLHGAIIDYLRTM